MFRTILALVALTTAALSAPMAHAEDDGSQFARRLTQALRGTTGTQLEALSTAGFWEAERGMLSVQRRLRQSGSQLRHPEVSVSWGRAVVTYTVAGRDRQSDQLHFYAIKAEDGTWQVDGSNTSIEHRSLYLAGMMPARVAYEGPTMTDEVAELGRGIALALTDRDAQLPPKVFGGEAAAHALFALRQLEGPRVTYAHAYPEIGRAVITYADEVGSSCSLYMMQQFGSWMVYGYSFGPPSIDHMVRGLETTSYLF